MSFNFSTPENRYKHKVDKELADGMVIIYRHLSYFERKQCLYKYMKNGKLDKERMDEFLYGAATEMFEGWEGVIDDKTKKPVKFKKKFVKSLPIDLIVDFQDAVGMKHFSDLIISMDYLVKKGKKARSKQLKNS